MQFGFSVAEAIGLQRSGVALLTDQSLRSMPLSQQKKVEIILDGMGRGSQAAQGLPSPVTNLAFIRDSHHFLFLAVDEDRCLGILKGGVKHLFMLDSQNETHEMDAMCCLDFYTHETMQRRGIGTRLFRAMELHTHISAHGWAFDRPSSKLLAFLSKVYGMQDFKAQSNNFFMLDASIRLWGAEFKQYRRSKKHYIPDAYLLPETQECEYLGEAELTKRTPLRRSMAVDLQPETARSEDTQPRALTADELLSKRSVVLPTASRTPSLPDQPQSVAAAYMNKRIEEACPNFEQYMRVHYGAKSLIVPPGMRTPSSHSKDSVSQEDMIQRQWQLDRMAFVLARETNARGSIHSTIGRGATSGRRG